MAIYTFSSPAGRINKLAGEILKHAIPVEVIGVTGMQKRMPKNKGNAVVYRRYLPYGGVDNQWIAAAATAGDATFVTAHVTTEGTTPTADTLVPSDVTATLVQYSALYSLSDVTDDLYEEDVPAEMKKQVGERCGLVREMVRYGALKACTNIYYSGGTSRATVINTLTLNLLRNIARGLQANHAKTITQILAPSPNYDTQAVESAYVVFAHTDMEADIRDLTGFTPVAEYGTRKPINEFECGSVERFRFVLSPELVPIQDAGGTAVTNGLIFTTANTACDVYPVLIMGEDGYGQLALRGKDSIDPTFIKPNEKDSGDPLGQRGYVGAKFYFDAQILNNGWMAVAECGASAL